MIYAKLAILAYIGFILSQTTSVNMLLWDLILGFIGTAVDSRGECTCKIGRHDFVLAVAIVAIYAGLSRSTFDMVVTMIVPLIIYLAIGVAMMFVFGYIMAKF